MRRLWLGLVGATLAVALAAGGWLLWRVDKLSAHYTPVKNALYQGLAHNDFGYAYANEADLERLRDEFAFLAEAPNDRARVVALVRWLNANVVHREIESVRAVDILEAKAGACEVHTLAVAALAAHDIPARWICSVESSMGFGYLEAWVDGGWQLFRLRHPEIEVGQSAWQMYQASEPTLAIRTFWSKPGQAVRTFDGTVYPVILPFAAAQMQPELETIFRTRDGLDVSYTELNPYDYPFLWRVKADTDWVKDGTLYSRFLDLRSDGRANRRRFYGAVADRLGWTGLEGDPLVPADGPR